VPNGNGRARVAVGAGLQACLAPQCALVLLFCSLQVGSFLVAMWRGDGSKKQQKRTHFW
jgi:hypothetical protein